MNTSSATALYTWYTIYITQPGGIMLEVLLGLFVYDTVKTVSKKREQEEKRKQIDQLRFRLKRPMTRNHDLNCRCRLCVNRRESAINKLNDLLGA